MNDDRKSNRFDDNSTFVLSLITYPIIGFLTTIIGLAVFFAALGIPVAPYSGFSWFLSISAAIFAAVYVIREKVDGPRHPRLPRSRVLPDEPAHPHSPPPPTGAAALHGVGISAPANGDTVAKEVVEDAPAQIASDASCSFCQKPIPHDANVCPYCAKLVKVHATRSSTSCVRCQRAIPLDSKVCPYCATLQVPSQHKSSAGKPTSGAKRKLNKLLSIGLVMLLPIIALNMISTNASEIDNLAKDMIRKQIGDSINRYNISSSIPITALLMSNYEFTIFIRDSDENAHIQDRNDLIEIIRPKIDGYCYFSYCSIMFEGSDIAKLRSLR